MAGTVPAVLLDCCTPDCEETVSVAVPGPPGDDGTNGTNGAAGVSGFTTFTAAFTMPAEGASAVATVGTSAPFAVNQILYAAKTDGSVLGYLQVTAIGGAMSVTLKNIEDTATGVYADNSAPGSIFTIGSQLQPGGSQGPAGISAATTMVGAVTGTIGANALTLNQDLGALPVGNGTEAAELAKGTDGQMLVVDGLAVLDLAWKSTQPITGDVDLDTDRVPRLSAATGLPIPIKSSRASIKDAGGAGTLVLDARTAVSNARGTDAIDLQTSRSAVTQVASGQESVVAGGRRNTNNGVRATISGGDTNVINAAAQEATIAGGTGNSIGATGIQAAIGGGDTNSASGEESVIGGGDTNSTSAAATNSTIGGGRNNATSAIDTTIAGGRANAASAQAASVAGGDTNVASGTYAAVGGGANNAASGVVSVVPGGYGAVATNYGQLAHASGFFAAAGEAQTSEYVVRQQTANATPVELYADPSGSGRIIVPTDHSWMFEIQMVARRDNGLTSIYTASGVITNVAGVVTMPAAATVTEVFDGIGLPPAPVTVTADDPNNALVIGVTGIAGTNIRWCALIKTIEVKY